MCFERAGDELWEKRAKASGLKAGADRMRDSNPKVACTYLREAAEIFDSIGKAESAATCYYDSGEFEKAGIYSLFSSTQVCKFMFRVGKILATYKTETKMHFFFMKI